MRRTLLPLIMSAGLLVGQSRQAKAQQFAYGSPSELSGALWLFVYAGNDLEVHDNIVKTLLKDLPFLQIAGKPEEADVVLVFGANAYTKYYGTYGSSATNANAGCQGSASVFGNYISGQANCQGASSTTSSSIPLYGTIVNGTGWVLKLVPGGQPRLLLQYSDTRSTIFERRPSTNFARNFVKEYRKANPQPPAARPHPTSLTSAPATPSPELALFADKARGVLTRISDSLQLQGEWRALLTRRAAPTLEALFRVDPRASTAEMADASRAAAGDVGGMLIIARARIGPLGPELFRQLGAAALDTVRVLALFRDAAAIFIEANPGLSDEDVRRFLSICVDKFPGILAAKPTP